MAVQAGAAFGLRIPETWFEFDVWRATRTGDLARMVDQRLADLPELRPRRAVILRGLRQLAEDAERRGAVYCAAAADRIDDDGMLLASLMVFSTAGLPEPALNTVEAIAAQLTATGDYQVRVIDLDAGRAVRVRASEPIVSMQTLIPIPGSDDILNVVLTSPLVSMAEGLLDLFDAISATLSWEPGPT